MAAYYHSEIQASGDHGGLHTLILMNPNLAAASYSDSHHAPPPSSSHNILLLNSAAAAAAASATALSHPPPPLHNPQFIRLPPQQDNITLYGYPPQEARDVTRRLHLSLSSENPPPYGLISPQHNREGEVSGVGHSSVLGSKYLKATQELLEEVVHVGDGVVPKSSDESPRKASSDGDKLGGGGGAQLSTAERQEIQMKKAKLSTMLDEAEQKYRLYNQQMHIVIASFEQAAGYGSAKVYTSLALKTISKQFRCLKDTIHGQIRAANKTLGEEEGGSGGGGGGVKIEGSRLKYIDHQIRQQKALQQLGMIQNHNAWRPQRGLPERSVSVLRAWLFEHFLHPYPKDSDKVLLAKQTGLTRSQVSNWFINARVRLWKPMIEEMYAEETKEHEQQQKKAAAATTTEEKNSSKEEQEEASNDSIEQTHHHQEPQMMNPSSSSSSPPLMNIPGSSTSNSFFALQMEAMSEQGSPKRQRNDEIFIKFDTQHKQSNHNSNGYPIISGGMNFMGGDWFGAEDFQVQPPQQTPSRFLPSNLGNGNGISLSLGLPPFENNHHQHHQHHHNNHQQHMDMNTVLSPAAAAFECIDIQNRKGFAAQLLPDFVA